MKLFTVATCTLLFLTVQCLQHVQCLHIPYTVPSRHSEVENNCGYNACPSLKASNSGNDDGILNVHIIPHSHDDTGWLKTVDQYYIGSNRARFSGDEENQRVGVQYVLDSVIKELVFNPNRKYIQVEIAFFWRWWEDQDDRMQDEVKRLVNNGQLEFINGGWCMNDEASAHYTDIVHQMSLGMRFLNDTFGECANPKVAWQIDPFGHSKEQANLFAEMAFDGLFFGRLDYRDKNRRLSSEEMETIWYSNKNKSQSLFTGVLYNQYSPPPYFCWDILCNDEPLVDDPESHSYNLDRRIPDFINYVTQQASHFKTNNIALTMGMDFHYSAAHAWFTNLDKLIKYVNAETNEHGVSLVYSTPSCYLKALHESEVSDWPTKSDDFFPYGSDNHGYWTGYYTSRPTSKRMIREASAILNSAKQLVSKSSLSISIHGENIAGKKCNIKDTLDDLGHAVSVAQHHDAITGTEKQYVTEDYHYRLHKGVQDFMNCAADINIGVGEYNCPLLNISQCDTTENQNSFNVSIYNPLARYRSSVIRLPITNVGSAKVLLMVNGICEIELRTETLPIPLAVQLVPGRTSTARHELVFLAESLSPLQHTHFCIALGETEMLSSTSQAENDNKVNENVDIMQSSDGKRFYLDATSKSLVKLEKTDNFGKIREIEFTQQYFYYTGYQSGSRTSGAYIFRPNEISPTPLGEPTTSSTLNGEIFYEIHQTFFHALENKHVSQVIRIPRENTSFLFDAEIEWMIGPIPINDNSGKEYIHRIHVNGLENNGVYYTDANGRQYVERRRNYRPDFDIPNVESDEPVSANYYPVTSNIYMEDDNLRLTILTDRSQGGGSISDNEMELMLHRRLLVDDHWGVGEALNEMAFGMGLVARGKHYLLFDLDKKEAHRRTRLLANELYGQNLITFNWDKNHRIGSISPSSPITLQENINLLTLEPISDNKSPHIKNLYLVRFEHLFDIDEHPTLSLPVKIPSKAFIEGYFNTEIKSVEETTLGGDRLKYDALVQQLSWNAQGSDYNILENKANQLLSAVLSLNDFEEIELQPMQIRTFQIELM